MIDGVVLRPESTAPTLRQACRNCGIGQSGSRSVLFKRLKNFVERKRLSDSLALTEAAKPDRRDPVPQSEPPQPTAEERSLHELTHIPFQPWCSYCMAGRSRRDHRQSEGGARERTVPVVSMDFFYCVGNDKELAFMKPEKRAEGQVEEPKLTVVAVVDRSTGMLSAIPVPGKGHDVHVHVAKQVLQFLSHLGYSEVQLRGDNEPSMEQMLNTIMVARQKHGLKTQVVHSQPYVRESNGVAEQAIQNLRDIAVTHLAQLKEASGHEVSAINDLLGCGFCP